MNLYLVLALALGAVTGAPAPAPQATATILEARSERAAVCGPASAGRVSRDRLKPVHTRRQPLAARRLLTGAATPRAPARS
jgi:hypothetical protein